MNSSKVTFWTNCRKKREEVISTLEKNDELNEKHIQKTKKFDYLKFKPKNQSPLEENKEIITQKNRTNKHYKLSYAVVLKRKSNINLRPKLSKQKLAANETNNSAKNSKLNAFRSRSTSKNIFTMYIYGKSKRKQ